jgi:hypothetical protein
MKAAETEGDAGMRAQRKRDGRLPDGFADLEPFVADWAERTEAVRTARRHSKDIEAIRAFYEAMVTRIDDVLQTLNGCRLDTLTTEQKRLHYLTLSLCEVAPAIELYKQPGVVDGFDPARFPRVDIPHMTPPEV